MTLSERQSSAVFLALGTNLGDRLQNLKTVLQELSAQVEIEEVSSVYETPPWGYLDQPAFLNQVIKGRTLLAPQPLLSFVKNIEKDMGRIKNFQNGPRLIDIDILTFGEQIFTSPDLVIPHPRMAERAFVLVPLAEIEPALVIPGQDRTVKELLKEMDTSGIEKIAGNPIAVP